jgi:hypothetical protein
MIIWLATTAIGFASMLWSHFAYQIPKGKVADQQVSRRLTDAFPTDRSTVHGFVVRTERGPHYLYLAGLSRS